MQADWRKEHWAINKCWKTVFGEAWPGAPGVWAPHGSKEAAKDEGEGYQNWHHDLRVFWHKNTFIIS